MVLVDDKVIDSTEYVVSLNHMWNLAQSFGRFVAMVICYGLSVSV